MLQRLFAALLSLILALCFLREYLHRPVYDPLVGYWPAALSGDAPTAHKSLTNARLFSVGGIGFEGSINPAEIFSRKIIFEDDPSSVFMDILEHGTPEAKMYALCGLYFTNLKTYRKAAAPYRNPHDPVEIMEGCVGKQSTYENLIRELEAKRFEELSEALPKRSTSKSFRDICLSYDVKWLR
jgi:hypothetical protein